MVNLGFNHIISLSFINIVKARIAPVILIDSKTWVDFPEIWDCLKYTHTHTHTHYTHTHTHTHTPARAHTQEHTRTHKCTHKQTNTDSHIHKAAVELSSLQIRASTLLNCSH